MRLHPTSDEQRHGGGSSKPMKGILRTPESSLASKERRIGADPSGMSYSSYSFEATIAMKRLLDLHPLEETTRNKSKEDPEGLGVTTARQRGQTRMTVESPLNLQPPTHLQDPQSEKDMTNLVQMIWDRDWNAAEARLAQSSHRATEVSTERTLPCFPLRKSMGLPLHLACTMRPLPPASFVHSLVGAYPDACRLRQRTWGLLPLHLASDLSLHNKTAGSKVPRRYNRKGNGTVMPRLLHLSSTLATPSSRHDTPLEIPSSLSSLADEIDSTEAANHAHVIQFLIQVYPESIFAREDTSGMLPLHIAASTARSENGVVSPTSASVLQVLLESAPSSRHMEDGYGDTPISLAWREALFCCYHCGNNANLPCLCKNRVAVAARYLHPLIRDDIETVTLPSDHQRVEQPSNPPDESSTSNWQEVSKNYAHTPASLSSFHRPPSTEPQDLETSIEQPRHKENATGGGDKSMYQIYSSRMSPPKHQQKIRKHVLIERERRIQARQDENRHDDDDARQNESRQDDNARQNESRQDDNARQNESRQDDVSSTDNFRRRLLSYSQACESSSNRPVPEMRSRLMSPPATSQSLSISDPVDDSRERGSKHLPHQHEVCHTDQLTTTDPLEDFPYRPANTTANIPNQEGTTPDETIERAVGEEKVHDSTWQRSRMINTDGLHEEVEDMSQKLEYQNLTCKDRLNHHPKSMGRQPKGINWSLLKCKKQKDRGLPTFNKLATSSYSFESNKEAIGGLKRHTISTGSYSSRSADKGAILRVSKSKANGKFCISEDSSQPLLMSSPTASPLATFDFSSPTSSHSPRLLVEDPLSSSPSLSHAAPNESVPGRPLRILRIQLRLTELRRPVRSRHPKRAPNPYYEVYVTNGETVASRYKSYPLMGTTHGTWDEALIEVSSHHRCESKKTSKTGNAVASESDSGTLSVPPDGNPELQIGVRVMHCRKSQMGSKATQSASSDGPGGMVNVPNVIGLCRTSLRTLQEEPCQPILCGFHVTGWLEVIELSLL